MSIYISTGNIKVDALIFNLPCRVTCKPKLSCYAYCYARKAEVQYPEVERCRHRNLTASKNTDFVKNMSDILSRRRKKTMRIHESGDFYSVEYINNWFEIIKNTPNIEFYAYTKRDDLFTDNILKNKLANLTLIFSVDGIQDDHDNCKIPSGFDKVAYIHENDSNCPVQLNEKIKCGRECRKCIIKNNNNKICFKKH